MGYRQDYFKKQMDQMGQVLGKLLADILGIKSEGKLTDLSDLVSSVFEKEIGFDFDEVIQKDPKDVVHYLMSEKHFSNEHIEHIANILFELGMDANLSQKEREAYFVRATIMYEWLNTERKLFSFDFMLKINRMKEQKNLNQ